MPDTPTILEEMKKFIADVWAAAQADFKAGKYFTQAIILVAMPAVLALILVVSLFLFVVSDDEKEEAAETNKKKD